VIKVPKKGTQIIAYSGNQELRGAMHEDKGNGNIVLDCFKNGVQFYSPVSLKDCKLGPTKTDAVKEFKRKLTQAASDAAGGMMGGATGKEQ
jgi:hypothetical protein